jgi:hypothetical protein
LASWCAQKCLIIAWAIRIEYINQVVAVVINPVVANLLRKPDYREAETYKQDVNRSF